MSDQIPVCLWPADAELGEGPLWHAATQRVYFVDIRGRRVLACDADGSARRCWDAPGQPGFIVPTAQGDFIRGLNDGLYRFDPASGNFTLWRTVEAGQRANRLNDGHVDANGSLWFGSMDNGETQPSGALYRLDAKGHLRCADGGYVITNGPAFSPDGQTLYHTDTLEKRIDAFDVMADGTLARKRPWVRIKGDGYPDGMAVDTAGNVWVCLFGGARIARYSPAGKLLGHVVFPCSNVTKLAFGGEDLRTVYASTAWKGLDAAQRECQPLAGGLFRFRVDTPGLAQHRFLDAIDNASVA